MARKRAWLPGPAGWAALAAIVVYANSVGGGFVYDDILELLENDRIHSLSRIPELVSTDFWGAGEGRNPLYRPLTAVLDALTWNAGGGGPLLFHLLNLALHACASAAAASLLLALTASPAAALIGGLLFAVHPVHTEAVAWISGQAELTSALCMMLAWMAHLKGRTGCALLFLIPGLLSKEGTVVFPVLVLLGDLFAGGGLGGSARTTSHQWKRRFRAYAVYAAAVAGYLALRWMVLGHMFGGMSEGPPLLNPLRGVPVFDRMLTAVVVFGRAAEQSLAPVRLCLDYGFDQIPTVTRLMDPALLRAAGAAAVVAVLALLVRAREGLAAGRQALLGIGIFGCAFLPASNLLVPAISTFAERNLYLPVLGFCLVAALLLARPRWGRVAAGVIILIAAGRTVTRNPEFHDGLTLFGTASEACPRSARVRMFHGIMLREEGRVVEALAAQDAALAIAPAYADARSEKGLAHMLLGDSTAAEIALRAALVGNDKDREARSNLAWVLMESGRQQEALREYDTNARLNPDDPEVLGNQASAFLETGAVDRARTLFDQINRKWPESAQGPNGEGAILAQEGQWEAAATRFTEALRREPLNANAAFNLAKALVQTGDKVRALEVVERAIVAGVHDDQLLELRDQLRN